jgi:predicted SprT family Zn-dependent metalloprotease
MTMAAKKAKKAQRFTIACCRACQRTFEMTGTARQLRQERALRCPHCQGELTIIMEGERL